MAAPIRSQTEIDLIINKGNNAIADLALAIVKAGKKGKFDQDYRSLVYRIILLRAYLKNILTSDGTVRLYYQASANEKKFNILLDAIIELSGAFNGPGIPLIRGKRLPLYFYPSSQGSSQGGSSSSGGGPAVPGGVTFQNLDVDSPGEVVDRLSASASDYAFYIINIRGTGAGEGSRLDIVGVNWRGASTPVVTAYTGDPVGGTVSGVSFTAALVSGNIELTCNVPTDGWIVKGTRISFENISFQNVQGPLPSGGSTGQYLRKSSDTDFDAAFASILIAEISGLQTILDAKAPLSSPALTGNPTAPTQSPGDSSTKIATTAFVDAARIILAAATAAEASTRASADSTEATNRSNADALKADKATTLTAGNGLSGGGDLSANRTFSVNVDDSTVEISSDTVRVKDGGISTAKMADASVNSQKVDNDTVVTQTRATVNTGTGGTATTIATIPIPTNKIVGLDIDMVCDWVSGGPGAGSGARHSSKATYKNVSGTVSAIGLASSLHSVTTDASAPSSIILTISGTNVLVKAQAASGVNYAVTVKVKRIYND